MALTGTVFNIEEMTLHDGSGVRLTVFMKGCPLRCKWCHNPEGLSTRTQLWYKKEKCCHCGLCQQGCNHEDCKPFSRCLHICPNNAISLCGKVYTSDEIAKKINSYKFIFDATGGGVTFSGGEPTLQWPFVKEVISKLDGVKTAIETCGYMEPEIFHDVVNTIDEIFMDIKVFDEQKHIELTGVSNKKILDNFKYLKEHHSNFTIRTPLIEGLTDTEENVSAIAKLLEGCRWEKLPENKLSRAKDDMIIC